ncbi:MAG: DUF5606 domain-containing protein [Chitinophagaceae bacterium]|nr:DUF5606 domain-containing protein [Chitinophagaceae bacterium]
MEYSKIIAVTGLPGLQELISSKNDGAIVRSLEDKSTKFVSSRVHNFSHLESIEVYTVRDNVNLVDLFQAMEKSGVSLPDEKDAKAIKSYFEKVFPELDFERVYNSDMKKMVKWYSILKANNIEIKLREMPEEEEVVAAPVEEPAPAPKAAKTTKKKEAAPAATEEEAPKKKAAPKAKKETAEEETPKKKAAPKKK